MLKWKALAPVRANDLASRHVLEHLLHHAGGATVPVADRQLHELAVMVDQPVVDAPAVHTDTRDGPPRSRAPAPAPPARRP